MRLKGQLCTLLAVVFALPLQAAQFSVRDVPAITGTTEIAAHEIVLSELAHDEENNPVGLVPFEDWGKNNPIQKKFLSPFPDYVEPIVVKPIDGIERTITEKLLMYVTEARFSVSEPPGSIGLARFATVDFLRKLDTAIAHESMAAADADNESNKNPNRPWCSDAGKVTCVRSRYKLEGKLPMAVQLVNQLTDESKLDDFLEFQSELRVIAPPDLDQGGLAQLTGISTPVAGAIEQTIFHVNQIMQFGKFLAVLQGDPADDKRTLVTAYIALALKARPLESSKKYANVPILRNLVPGMVLAGKSSFNTGQSISGGLPLFSRNNLKQVAAILDERGDACAASFSLMRAAAAENAATDMAGLAVALSPAPAQPTDTGLLFVGRTIPACPTALLQVCATPCAPHSGGKAGTQSQATLSIDPVRNFGAGDGI